MNRTDHDALTASCAAPAPAPLPVVGPPRERLARRLTRAAVVAAGLALLFAGVALNVYLYLSARAAMTEDFALQARSIADNSAAAVMFGDRQAANDTLAMLEVSLVVSAADLFDAQGEPLATYRRPLAEGEISPSRTKPRLPAGEAMTRIVGGYLYLSQPVAQRGRTIGRLDMAVSLRQLHRRSALFAGITALSALGALGLAYLFALRLRREINETEARLDELAYVDPVTGLGNRHAASERMRQRVARGQAFGVMMLDLDDFKHVNDTLGHASGDLLLHTIAGRLRDTMAGRGQVFRLGGDEFVSIFDLPPEADGLARVGQEAMRALRDPLHLGTNELFVRGSAGISSFPADGADWSQLLRSADAAMYAAKAAGKNVYAVFRADMLQRSQRRLTLDSELRHALRRGELRLFYQPVVALSSGRIVGAEALLRWQHPQRGLVGPADFIAAAEESGLVVEMGQWVLMEAARQVALWRERGHDDFYVAVNVSGRQIKRGILQRQVRAALEETGAQPTWLELEITEHSLVEDLQANLDSLNRLREMGMGLAIDDFGTGLSSLAYLKRLPLNKLKIDRSFVRELPEQRDDVAIATAVISMARALGLKVVAEGVETPEQRETLRGMGCDFAQGYLYGRPVPAQDMEGLLQAQREVVEPAAL
jgi:diguanylate cyclase